MHTDRDVMGNCMHTLRCKEMLKNAKSCQMMAPLIYKQADFSQTRQWKCELTMFDASLLFSLC